MAAKTPLFDTCDIGTTRVPPAHEAKAAVKLNGPVPNVRNRARVPLSGRKPVKYSVAGASPSRRYSMTMRSLRLRDGAALAWPSTAPGAGEPAGGIDEQRRHDAGRSEKAAITVAEVAVTAPDHSQAGSATSARAGGGDDQARQQLAQHVPTGQKAAGRHVADPIALIGRLPVIDAARGRQD